MRLLLFVTCVVCLLVYSEASGLSGYVDNDLPAPTLNDDSYEWLHSVLIYRHTVRSPSAYIASNLDVTPAHFPRGTGFATDRGLNLAIQTGQTWRKRFSALLGDANPRKAFARASNVPRCFETTEAVTRGMFENPGFGEAILNPIPITRAPTGQDKYVDQCGVKNPGDWSPIYNFTGVPGGKFETVGEVLQFVREQANVPASLNDWDLFAYYLDAYVCAKWNQDTLPDWIEENYDAIEWVHDRTIADDTPYGGLNVFYGHNIMQAVADKVEQIAENGGNEALVGSRITFFGYHDKTIQAILNEISDDYLTNLPSFIGGLFIDMFANKNNASDVQVLVGFSKGLIDIPTAGSPRYAFVKYADVEPVTMTECTNPCPLDKFLQIFRAGYAGEMDQYNCGCTGTDAKV